MERDFLTTREAAEKACVSIQVITGWCERYGIGIKVGGRWRIDPAVLDYMLQGGNNEAHETK